MSPQPRAFWTLAPGRGAILDVDVRPPAATEVMIRTLYSAISRGTETLVFAGRVPPGEHARMRAPFQEGEFTGAVKYGYISVGEVIAGADQLQGRPVFCLYPHQTHYTVPAAAIVPLPLGVPPARAVLAANMETAFNAVLELNPPRGRLLSVIGAGAVGCLTAWLARHRHGAEVELIDINPDRASIAAQLGLSFRTPATATRGAARIVHASGAPAGLETALELAGFEATITELSWYGDTRVSLPLGGAFHSQRLTLQSSQVGHVARPARGHFTLRTRMQYALRLLSDSALDCLIDAESNFDALPELLPALTSGELASICHRIRYPGV